MPIRNIFPKLSTSGLSPETLFFLTIPIGTKPFTNTKGHLRVRQEDTTAIVAGDVNGDGVADFEIALLNFTDLSTLTAIDFLR